MIDMEFINSRERDVIKEFPLKIEEYQNRKNSANMFMGVKSRTQDTFKLGF
jgi:hypothetical protein